MSVMRKLRTISTTATTLMIPPCSFCPKIFKENAEVIEPPLKCLYSQNGSHRPYKVVQYFLKGAKIAILAIIWSLNLCKCSLCRAKSAWLPSIWGAKSALPPYMSGAHLQTFLCTWKGAMQTLLHKWKGTMHTLLCT